MDATPSAVLSPGMASGSPSLDETRATLELRAKKRFGHIPAELIAAHVLDFARDGDFAVQSAALEALTRRMGFALRDELAVSRRPRRAILGEYRTRRKGAERAARPYTIELETVDPIRGSCDCPDYLRSSLGLCKHLLLVLDWIHTKPARVAQARREQDKRATPKSLRSPRLEWDPRWPLSGPVDRLAGLRSDGAPPPKASNVPAERIELLRALGRQLASPAARAVIGDELERAERRARAEASAKAALRALSTLKRKLYPYQREGVERFLRAGRLLLADDMGLGKTTQAVAACHALFGSKRVRRGLLIVPAALKSQWVREWEATSAAPIEAVDGTPAERAACYARQKPGFLMVGYEQLLRDFEPIRALAPEIVVLDEAQRIKNWSTKTAAFVKALDPEYRLVLTGTPMENRLEELASILDFVDDLCLAPKWRLEAAYASWTGGGGDGRAGARNLTTLRARMAPRVVRRVRSEVLSQLPPRTDTRVPVAMTERQREEHDALAQPIAELHHKSKQRPLTQPEFLRLMSLLTTQRIVSNGLGQLNFDALWPTYRTARPDPALLDGLFAPKLGELRSLVEDLVVAQQRKVVIFSQWRKMLRLAEWATRDILAPAGARAVFFTGAESQRLRARAIVDFHDRPEVRLMFLSDAGGVGLNLQRAANACINLELPWNPAVLEQRIGRIYRLGQKDPIDVYTLVNEYGIEAHIAGILGTKRALFTSVFEGTSDEVTFDGSSSFMAQIERLVDLPKVPAPARAGALDLVSDEQEADRDADTPGAELASDEEVEPAVTESAAATGAAPVMTDVSSLFGALRVERTKTGGVVIEAPPEAAATLAALFDGMARLVSMASPPCAATSD